jgi:hypothetical protein
VSKKTPSINRVCVYLSLDTGSISRYYNANDPAPLASRQLSHEFQEYLNTSVAMARRHTKINYKIFCGEATGMRFLIEPLTRAVRRHYRVKREIAQLQFNRFKRKNYVLLCISFLIVMFCQGLLPIIFNQEHRIHSVLSNALDVFSWVILWKPIERLIFYWNPFLKDIHLYKKMEACEAIIVDNEQELINHHMEHVDAA